MKSDLIVKKSSQPVSESRKIRKPLMEKKRRARINDSLETLKQILLESKTTLKESTGKSGQRTAKLEKADILEMTVKYLQVLHGKLYRNKYEDEENVTIRAADSSSTPCESVSLGVTVYPTKLSGGEIVFLMPSTKYAPIQPKPSFQEKFEEVNEKLWRPW